MPQPNWLNQVTGPNILSGSVALGRQPNLQFLGAKVTSDPLNQQNIVTINDLDFEGATIVTTVPTGSYSFPQEAAGFIQVTINGVTHYIPFY